MFGNSIYTGFIQLIKTPESWQMDGVLEQAFSREGSDQKHFILKEGQIQPLIGIGEKTSLN